MSEFITRWPNLAARFPVALAQILAGVALLTLSARIQVPFWPVPMTLQTLAVMLLALSLGPRRAFASVAGYLTAAATGLPVLAGSATGIAALAGPTGGFLVGMLALAFLTGYLGYGQGLLVRIFALISGNVVLYAAGLAWLSMFIPGERLLSLGFFPFLAGDLVKIAICAISGKMVFSATSRLQSRR